jgi:hypothetical protein
MLMTLDAYGFESGDGRFEVRTGRETEKHFSITILIAPAEFRTKYFLNINLQLYQYKNYPVERYE